MKAGGGLVYVLLFLFKLHYIFLLELKIAQAYLKTCILLSLIYSLNYTHVFTATSSCTFRAVTVSKRCQALDPPRHLLVHSIPQGTTSPRTKFAKVPSLENYLILLSGNVTMQKKTCMSQLHICVSHMCY